MSREERDKLQERFDEYERFKNVKSKFKFQKAFEEIERTSLGFIIEPFIPTKDISGFDASIFFHIFVRAISPKLADRTMKFAIVTGHKEAWAKLERDPEGKVPKEAEKKFYDEYGISIPSDIARTAMDIRTSKQMSNMTIPKVAERIAEGSLPGTASTMAEVGKRVREIAELDVLDVGPDEGSAGHPLFKMSKAAKEPPED